jgi:hypothetical protein
MIFQSFGCAPEFTEAPAATRALGGRQFAGAVVSAGYGEHV